MRATGFVRGFPDTPQTRAYELVAGIRRLRRLTPETPPNAGQLRGFQHNSPMTKEEVAQALECSTRQVEKYAHEQRLGQVEYVKGKRGRQASYKAEEVERLKGELERERAEVIGHGPAPSALAPRPPQSQALAVVEQITAGLDRQHADAERFAVLLEAIRDAVTNGHTSAPLAEIDLKLTLSVAEAGRLSGFSPDALREAINAGKLKAKIVKGRRGWTIKREDLDKYVKGL